MMYKENLIKEVYQYRPYYHFLHKNKLTCI